MSAKWCFCIRRGQGTLEVNAHEWGVEGCIHWHDADELLIADTRHMMNNGTTPEVKALLKRWLERVNHV